MRAVALAALIAFLPAAVARADEEQTARDRRATGITMTTLGLAHAIIMVGFGGDLGTQKYCGHNEWAAYACQTDDSGDGPSRGDADVVIMLGTGVVAASMIIPGVVLWAIGERDLKRSRRVSLSPLSLRASF